MQRVSRKKLLFPANKLNLILFKNGHFYDEDLNKYVNFETVNSKVKAGMEIHVKESRTNRDITAACLVKLIWLNERSTTKSDVQTLRDIIAHGGTFMDYIESKWNL